MESAFFDGVKLERTDKVRHLGNFIDTTCTYYIACIVKKSHFIGYVNKLKVNFGKMTHNVLINLFKSYCCSFYSSHLRKFNSHGFDKICKSWNIAIRTLLQLPFNAHTWLLGPITEQVILLLWHLQSTCFLLRKFIISKWNFLFWMRVYQRIRLLI